MKQNWKYGIIFEALDEEIHKQGQIDICESLQDADISELARIVDEFSAKKEILTFTRALTSRPE